MRGIFHIPKKQFPVSVIICPVLFFFEMFSNVEMLNHCKLDGKIHNQAFFSSFPEITILLGFYENIKN